MKYAVLAEYEGNYKYFSRNVYAELVSVLTAFLAVIRSRILFRLVENARLRFVLYVSRSSSRGYA